MTGFKEVDVMGLKNMLAQGGVRLVDVRTDAEIAQGIIGGAEKMPLHVLPAHLGELDAAATTVFYCRMGGRSAQAAGYAAAQGFSDAYNLLGGITAWAQAGLPIAKS